MALPGGGYDGNSIKITNANVFIPEIWDSEIRRLRKRVEQHLHCARRSHYPLSLYLVG